MKARDERECAEALEAAKKSLSKVLKDEFKIGPIQTEPVMVRRQMYKFDSPTVMGMVQVNRKEVHVFLERVNGVSILDTWHVERQVVRAAAPPYILATALGWALSALTLSASKGSHAS